MPRQYYCDADFTPLQWQGMERWYSKAGRWRLKEMALTTLSMFFDGSPLSVALSIAGLVAFLWLLYKAVELLIEF